MALSNTYSPTPNVTTVTGSSVGNREDLSDVLTILAPEDTPVTSLCAKAAAKSTFHEWTVDELATPNADGINEGSDVTSFTDKFAGRARLGNYTQKFRRDYLVSDLQEAVTSVGPANIAQAQAKGMREVKRDIELSLCSNSDRQAEDGSGSSPYKSRGLGDWIDSAGPSDVPAAYRTPSGSIITSALTESSLNDSLGSIYSKTGEMGNLTLVANVALRKVIANFTRLEGSTTATAYNVNEPAGDKKVTLSVSLFDSDFGMVKIVNANPACMPAAETNEGYILDPKYLGVGTLIPMGNTRLENKGGGERGFVDCAATLVCNSPLAHGKIAYS
jgi:hypothetical protein